MIRPLSCKDRPTERARAGVIQDIWAADRFRHQVVVTVEYIQFAVDRPHPFDQGMLLFQRIAF